MLKALYKGVPNMGKTIEGSGLDDFQLGAELYSNAVVTQMIHGWRYIIVSKCYQITLQVISNLLWDSFLQNTLMSMKKQIYVSLCMGNKN